MKNILILFAHPRFEQSRVHQTLIKSLPISPNITFRDLYELYPDFNIDIQTEQELLLMHDVIVWQHPFYWYSSPPLLKQWIDMVLEFGWAYGPGGVYLKDKWIFNVISSGGTREVYQTAGRNRYTVSEFLRPFEQTARLCGMHYLPPFAVQGTHKIDQTETEKFVGNYYQLITSIIRDELDLNHAQSMEYLNDLPSLLTPTKS